MGRALSPHSSGCCCAIWQKTGIKDHAAKSAVLVGVKLFMFTFRVFRRTAGQ